jgi:hypothetical protein
MHVILREHIGYDFGLWCNMRTQGKLYICSASRELEIVALDILGKDGWRSNNKIYF